MSPFLRLLQVNSPQLLPEILQTNITSLTRANHDNHRVVLLQPYTSIEKTTCFWIPSAHDQGTELHMHCGMLHMLLHRSDTTALHTTKIKPKEKAISRALWNTAFVIASFWHFHTPKKKAIFLGLCVWERTSGRLPRNRVAAAILGWIPVNLNLSTWWIAFYDIFVPKSDKFWEIRSKLTKMPCNGASRANTVGSRSSKRRETERRKEAECGEGAITHLRWIEQQPRPKRPP